MAKIGRVMKKDENFTAHRPSRTTVALTCDAGPHALQAVDDDELAGGEAVAHDAQAVDHRPERDRARLDLLVAADDEHEAAIEIGADGAILDEHARVGRPCPAGAGGRTGPGVRRRSALRKTARPLIVPVDGSSWLSRNCSVPSCGNVCFVGERHLNRQAASRAARCPAARRGRRSAGTSARRRRTRRRSDRPRRPWSAASLRPGRPRRGCRASRARG